MVEQVDTFYDLVYYCRHMKLLHRSKILKNLLYFLSLMFLYHNMTYIFKLIYVGYPIYFG